MSYAKVKQTSPAWALVSRALKALFTAIALSFSFSVSAWEFERNINEIQVLSDRVRLHVGTTYGTCGNNEGWWGWMLTNPASSHWLSLALLAQSQGKKVVVYDAHGSCGGIGDGVALEGLYLKAVQ